METKAVVIGVVVLLVILTYVLIYRKYRKDYKSSSPREPYFYDPTGSGSLKNQIEISKVVEKSSHLDSLLGSGYMGLKQLSMTAPADLERSDYHLLDSSYDGNSLKQIPRHIPSKFMEQDNDGLVYGEIQPRRGDYMYGMHGKPFPREPSLLKGVL